MIDIEELLLKEETQNKGSENIFFDSDYNNIDSVANSLVIQKHISIYRKMNQEDELHYRSHNLTKEEAFILILFTGHGSKNINQSLSDRMPKLNELQELITEYFDIVLSKINKANISVVFLIDKHSRELKENAKKWFCSNIGNVIKIPWYLSTTSNPWKDDSPLFWEIKLLPQSQTAAHTVYEIIKNHGEEFEVRFERNVKFFVQDVKEKESKTWVYLEEVEKNAKEQATLVNTDYSDKEDF